MYYVRDTPKNVRRRRWINFFGARARACSRQADDTPEPDLSIGRKTFYTHRISNDESETQRVRYVTCYFIWFLVVESTTPNHSLPTKYPSIGFVYAISFIEYLDSREEIYETVNTKTRNRNRRRRPLSKIPICKSECRRNKYVGVPV